VSANELHERFLKWVGHMHDKPVFVTADIENDTVVRNEVDVCSKGCFYICRTHPVCFADDLMPRPQRPFRLRIPLPKGL
jgi:hypothetical protein